jgi:hypothetical protein
MKTDALIETLAAHGSASAFDSVSRRYASALAAGTAVAMLVTLSTLGPRHDFAHAIMLPMFWLKTAFVSSLAILGTLAAFRAGLPGRRVSPMTRGIVAIVGGMWVVAAVALAEGVPQARAALLFGDTWRTCPWLIAGLSIPVYVAMATTIRRMAPTHLRRVGALAGFASGATAALVYSVHCPELAAPFLATWYVLGMLIPTLAGAMLGERLFRW